MSAKILTKNRLFSVLLTIQFWSMKDSVEDIRRVGTSHRVGFKNDIQTRVAMDPSPKTIELCANKIQ